MNPPIFIELPEGEIINAARINYIRAYNNGPPCDIYFSESAMHHGNGSWSAGGSGTMNTYTEISYIRTNISKTELMELINKELALIHAITKAANA